MTARVFCVLKSGGAFEALDVEMLQIGIRKYLPGYELHCLSDTDVPCERIALNHDWQGWWSKMELFRPDLHGDIFYLDLDTVILGDISRMAAQGMDTLLDDFYYPWRCASGLMYLTEASRAQVWNRWITDPEYNMHYCGKGDQTFLNELPLVRKAHRWQKDFPNQVISFKMHMRPSPPLPKGPQLLQPPKSARIVCFHGIPRPRQINESWVHEAWEAA